MTGQFSMLSFMDQADDIRMVFCTCPTEDVALAIAASLVEEHLAACVNIVNGVRSVYRWNNKTEVESECQLIIKTTNQRLKALEQAVTDKHPYELPELVVVPISDGSTAYLDWIRKNT